MNALGRLLVALILFSLVSAAAVAAQPPARELENNGGFEELEPDPGTGVRLAKGFENRGYTPAKAYRTGDGELDTTRHSGKFAQYLYGGEYPQGLPSGCKAKSGRHYRFRCWVKVGTGGYADVHAISTPNYYFLGALKRKIPPGDWEKAELTVTCPEGEQGILFHLFIGGGVYVDDMSLREVPQGPPVPMKVLQQIRKKLSKEKERPPRWICRRYQGEADRDILR